MDRGSIAGQTVRGEEGCAKGGEECSLPAGRVGDWLCAGRKDGVSWVVVRGATLTAGKMDLYLEDPSFEMAK